MQQNYNRKCTTNKRIIETRNKKRKTSAVVVTTGNQYVVASTIAGLLIYSDPRMKLTVATKVYTLMVARRGRQSYMIVL